MTEGRATVTNALGLHARAAAKFVEVASRFPCTIRVSTPSRSTEGKSILGLLLLAAARGTELVIVAEGPQEDEAVAALVQLTGRGFDVA